MLRVQFGQTDVPWSVVMGTSSCKVTCAVILILPVRNVFACDKLVLDYK